MAEPYTGSSLGPLQRSGGEDWSDFPEVSKAAKEDWSDFPEKSNATNTAKDIAKSAGIGVAKGTIGLAGLPGDMANFLAKGSQAATNFIAEKTGLDPGPQAGEALLPTSASINHFIGDNPKTLSGLITGENGRNDIGKALDYKPQTLPGHYAETIGEFAPAAVAGPGGFLRKAALGAIIPGAASEAAGQATAGSQLEPYARAAAGITAGVGGALMTQPSQAGQIIRQQFAEAGVTPKIVEDARKLMNSGVKLSWPEALSKASGSPVLTDKLRALESDPVTSGKMAKFFSDRPQQVDAAGMKAVSEIAPATRDPFQIGPQVGKAAQDHIGDVRGVINKASEPYYKAAEGVQFSPEEYALINPNNKPSFKEAIDNLPRGVKAADALADPLYTPQKFKEIETIPGYAASLKAVRNAPDAWRIQHLPDNSVGVLDKIKQHFDQQAKNVGSKFNPEQSQSVQSSHEMSASAVRQIGIAKSADYAQALDIQQVGREKFLDPLLQGPIGRLAKKDVTTQKAIEALFPSNPLPNSHEIIADTVAALAKKNPGAASQLVRAHVESVFNEATQSLMGGPAQWGGAKFAAILTGNPQQRANLKAAMEALPNGKDIWRGTEGFLDAMEAIGTRQAKGSLTAFNPDQLKSLSASNFVGSAARLGASPGKWWKAIDEVWAGINKGKNMNTLADILTDPKSVPLLKRIAVMPTGSREAGYVTARLIAQSENASVQPRESRRQ